MEFCLPQQCRHEIDPDQAVAEQGLPTLRRHIPENACRGQWCLLRAQPAEGLLQRQAGGRFDGSLVFAGWE